MNQYLKGINTLLFLLIVGQAMSSLSNGKNKNKSFTYKNPIISKDIPAIRDPQIIPYDGAYFLIGSSPPFWGSKMETTLRLELKCGIRKICFIGSFTKY